VKIGAEDKKKVLMLSVLGLGALYGVYSTFLAGPSAPSSTTPVKAVEKRPEVEMPSIPAAEPSAPRAPRSARREEFHPVLHSKRKEDQIDPATVDPTIKWDLLAKLQEVPPAGSGRNLFQFGALPPKVADLKGPETIVKPKPIIGPPLIPPPPVDPGPPPPPPPAPFNAKYYGLATSASNGRKRAFFLDGENIIIRSEGDTVMGHFKVVRIGVSSVIVEDTSSKRQQTVNIADEAVQG
jgi:hypothetical protein